MDFANTTQSARIIINMIVGIQEKKKKKKKRDKETERQRESLQWRCVRGVSTHKAGVQKRYVCLSPFCRGNETNKEIRFSVDKKIRNAVSQRGSSGRHCQHFEDSFWGGVGEWGRGMGGGGLHEHSFLCLVVEALRWKNVV